MKILNLNFLILSICFIFIVGCKKSEKDDNNNQGETYKDINVETYYSFSNNMTSFEVSPDGNKLYFVSNKNVFRYNKSSNQLDTILKAKTYDYTCNYVHIESGKLYVIYLFDWKGYIAISENDGTTWEIHETGRYTNVAAGLYEGAFVNNYLNRLFELSDGTLMIPDIAYSGSGIVHSQDGGKTWTAKASKQNYIGAVDANDRYYAISKSESSTFPTKHMISDDKGDTWTEQKDKSILATDINGNLISHNLDKFYKKENGVWKNYQFSASSPIKNTGTFSYSDGGTFNSNGVRVINRRDLDVEFDSQNNLYFLYENKIYKTKLD